MDLMDLASMGADRVSVHVVASATVPSPDPLEADGNWQGLEWDPPAVRLALRGAAGPAQAGPERPLTGWYLGPRRPFTR